MKLFNTSLISLFVLGSVVSVASAEVTTEQNFETCRSAAEVAFGSVDEKADVRLEGVRKSGKQLRLRVFTPEGEGLAVLCDVDKKTGELIALNPPQKLAPELALRQND